ncbi:MAG: hypothetical protein JWN86_2911 [Planctomycetota bacterium]|nr:hypothetical protein [Planctomycetota bacterium]
MISIWSEGVADENMSEAILVDQAGVIRRHPWWLARARLTVSLLKTLEVVPPSRVLDAGCGWGVTLEALENRGYQAVGMDISGRALEMLDRRRGGRSLAQADLTRPMPEGLEPFDAVLALDVIEHLDDDRSAVERLGQLARPGGIVIVSVPAMPEMFSEFDQIQGHRRRYLPDTLRGAFSRTGLELERVFWWGSWLVPTLKRQRRRPLRAVPGESPSATYGRYLRLPPWPLPQIMNAAFAFEHGRAIAGQLRRGTSLFAIARKSQIQISTSIKYVTGS